MTSETITLKKGSGKKKTGEIYRFQKFISENNLDIEKISIKTEVSVRTITHCIYDNKPLGGKLIRALHQFYGVSIDWLISGKGQMIILDSKIQEDHEKYVSKNKRTQRIIQFIEDWMSYSTEDEQAWLETQLKFNLQQYKDYLAGNKNG